MEKNKKYLIVLIVIIVLIVLGLGMWYLLGREDKGKEQLENKEDTNIISNNTTETGIEHKISFEESKTNYENNLYTINTKILVDGNVIKEVKSKFLEGENKSPEIRKIRGTDGKEYSLVVIYEAQEQFIIINHNGELIGVETWSSDNSIDVNGIILKYEINDDSIIVPVVMDEGEYIADQYKITVNNDKIEKIMLKGYKEGEAIIAGK